MLARIMGCNHDEDIPDFSDDERRNLAFRYKRIYKHAAFRLNYTTYDVRRAQDTINPRTSHTDIMVLSRDDEEGNGKKSPFWYGRVLGVFHVHVRQLGLGGLPKSMQDKRMDFLWVRWFGKEPGYRWGFKAQRLERVGYLVANDPGAFGFVDPQDVIRGCHLIPAFEYGQTPEFIGPSMARDHPDGDWESYYVSRYAS